MTTPEPSPAAPETEPENPSAVVTVSGKALVTGFLVVGALVIATATGLRFAHRDQIRAAQQQAMPKLVTDVRVECLVPGQPPRALERRGRCPASATLRLSNRKTSPDVKATLFAVAGEESHVVGTLPLPQSPEGSGAPVEVPALAGKAGHRSVAIILSATPLHVGGLQETADRIPTGTDLFGRLARIESFVTLTRQQGVEARAERFDFEAE